MFTPSTKVPSGEEAQKEWAKNWMRGIYRAMESSFRAKSRDKMCYDIWNGLQKTSDFNYLRKVGEYEYPAKVRFVPLLRPRGDRLRTVEETRGLMKRVFTIDQDSIERKESAKTKQILTHISSTIQERYQGVKAQIDQLMQLEQQIAQQQQEGGEPDPEMAQQVQQIMSTIQTQKYVLDVNSNSLTKDIKEIEKYYDYEYKDFVEEIMENGLDYLIQKYDLRSVVSDCFTDLLVTDKAYYCIEPAKDGYDPQLRRVNPLNFYYSNDDDVNWVDECEWVSEERWLTVAQVIDEFPGELSNEDIAKIQEYAKSNTTPFTNSNKWAYDGEDNLPNGNVEGGQNGLSNGYEDYGNRVRVVYGNWIGQKKLQYTKSKDKNGSFHTHWLGDGETYDPSKKLIVKHVNEAWEGILIGKNIFVRCQKAPVQYRSIDELGKVYHKYVGPAYNGIDKKPYSIIWAAKDIQIMYNLIHYHKELWLALSGVRGFIMDHSQLPKGMSMKEWLYQRKLGIGWIDTMKDGRPRQFNQFQNFDDTITPNIQYLIMILEHLENLASNVMGVSRERLGQQQAADQVGTTMAAIENSTAVTEMLFYKHDKIQQRAMTRLVNAAANAWKKGRRGAYTLGDFKHRILNVPEGSVDSAEYETFIGDRNKLETAMRDIKGAAMQKFSQNMLSVEQMIKLYKTDNLNELEKTFSHYSEMAETKISEGNQAERQAELEKMDKEYGLKKMIEDDKRNLEGLQLELENKKLQADIQKFEVEQGIKKDVAVMQNDTDRYDIDSERAVESAYLGQQVRESESENQLRKMEIAIDGIDSVSKDAKKQVAQKEKIKD